MFVYDADMEWDFGMPWYRPTRVNHATSGSELGWRSGTGKWPAYYVDQPARDGGHRPGLAGRRRVRVRGEVPREVPEGAVHLRLDVRHDVRDPHRAERGDVQGDEGRVRQPHPAAADGRVHQPGRRRDVLHDRRPRHAERAVPRDLRRQGDRPRRPSTQTNSTRMREAAAADSRRSTRRPRTRPRPSSSSTRTSQTRRPLHRYAARVALEHQPVKAWQDTRFGEQARRCDPARRGGPRPSGR